jgi:hypothetical protein
MDSKPLLLIVDCGNPSVIDYTRHAALTGDCRIVVVTHPVIDENIEEAHETCPVYEFDKEHYDKLRDKSSLKQVVIFLSEEFDRRSQKLLDCIEDIVDETPPEAICLISSFRVHFGDREAIDLENSARERFRKSSARLTVFRAGILLGKSSRAEREFRQLAPLYPLVPGRLRSTILPAEVLYDAVEKELRSPSTRRNRTFTLLGKNEAWREVLKRYRKPTWWQRYREVMAWIGAVLLIGQLATIIFQSMAWFLPRLRYWNFDTLVVHSQRELLELYHPYSFQFLKVVGYNNGVVHFGHQHPGKTILSTVGCQRMEFTDENTVKLDNGVLLKQVIEDLRPRGKEMYVIPNYSYVSMGTAYFVPIHGSASEYTTVGETIEKVVLYDPEQDRILCVKRDDETFRKFMYCQDCHVVLLRLYLRFKDKSRYYLEKETLTNPGSEKILSAFQHPEASNVEIRKSKASSDEVDLYTYFTADSVDDTDMMEFPRDNIGKIWDKIEGNRVTAWLFHKFMKALGYHTELFFTPEEFPQFWETHKTLPISKIQLRYVKQDGLPHSPFGSSDRISADVFMLKMYKERFEKYLSDNFQTVAHNPGKHSM